MQTMRSPAFTRSARGWVAAAMGPSQARSS
jgi:hypothetical protein